MTESWLARAQARTHLPMGTLMSKSVAPSSGLPEKPQPQVLHVDVRTGAVTKVLDEPLQALSGAKWCPPQSALFVAATLSGRAFVYYLTRNPADAAAPKKGGRDHHKGGDPHAANATAASGAAAPGQGEPRPWYVKHRVSVQLSKIPPWYINDVTLTDDSAVFSDSFAPRLWSIPRFHYGNGPPPVTFYDLGAPFAALPGQFKANGVAAMPVGDAMGGSADSGRTVLLANLHEGNLYKVDMPPSKRRGFGLKRLIGLEGGARLTKIALPPVEGKRLLLDGLWFEQDGHTLYAADNFHNRVVELQLGLNATSAAVTCVIAPKQYRVPTTLAVTGEGAGRVLWAVNAHLTTCLPFVPCPGHAFELVGVPLASTCGGSGGGSGGGVGSSGNGAGRRR
jgi:sugar lactone lactonase YvrE